MRSGTCSVRVVGRQGRVGRAVRAVRIVDGIAIGTAVNAIRVGHGIGVEGVIAQVAQKSAVRRINLWGAGLSRDYTAPEYKYPDYND